MKEHCEFAIIEKERLLPRSHNIGNNMVILENLREERVYRRCKNYIQEKFVIQEKLVDNCVRNIEVKLYNPIDAIIFLRLLLNNLTIKSNIQLI